MHASDAEPKFDIEQLLADGKPIQIKPQGYSMYPLFVPGRDEAIIAPADPKHLRRGDVALYRRDGGILVLHRIWKRKNGSFYLVGDNQKEIEGPLRADQMKGVLIKVVRNGREFSTRHPIYRFLSSLWLMLRPIRPWLSRAKASCMHFLGMGKKGGK